MPPPIVPAPTTAADFMGMSGVSLGTSGIFPTSRSLKKTWMSALDWSEKRHSVKSFCSTWQPSAKGNFVAEFFVVLARLRCGFGSDFVGKRDCAGEKIAFDDAVNDAELQGFHGFYRIAGGAHLDGFCDTRETGKALRAGGAGNDAEFYFGLADLRAGNSDAIVASHGDFQAATESCAVNGDDHGLAVIFEFQEEREQAFTAGLSGSHLAEFFQVCAGDEGAAAADQDDGFDGGVLRDLIERFGNAFGDARAERVDRRIIDGDDGDAVFLRELHEIGHRKNPWFADLHTFRRDGAGVNHSGDDALAVKRAVAECRFQTFGPAVVKVHVVFPGEAHAAVNLDAAVAYDAGGSARVHFSDGNCDSRVRGNLFQRPSGIIHRGAANLRGQSTGLH
jgi:hypothetical protein